ncbi:antitoxin Xre/MbcA/ParS toxin-binding domain-containing protein [Mucilaginibacter sp. FT3.2]|uniref:type II RES/Xre toxin-antitoxin system antitoxin n=1 Tax=Mucilaginibacter sp. FT3.2 TaxID=2723090 RepID=UPI001620A3BA|nr:antitoxin Xre/MbcA/ParS toxin-binding domain-containing protein [Mucilaginibacter sp. FT3.2]MBB6235262.1 putative toxin-antitoxin system antitoxin component (TIGR02293 family) [Mucilaginibacter sp. FT3.2]
MTVLELLDINVLNGVETSKHLYSDFDFITLSNNGISKASVEALIGHIGMSKKSFAEDILHLLVKTLERKKSDDKFDKYASSHVIEIAKVVEHAFEVFEDAGKVQRWLNSPNRTLNNMKPLELFYIPTGLAMVDNILGRIEEGVCS